MNKALQTISFTVNGSPFTTQVGPGTMLLDLLRGSLGLTGTKEGCGEGECGACTVIVDGMAVNSCLYPALELQGRTLLTIEGLSREPGQLSLIQRAFVDEGAIQCGFCTPGMIMKAHALLLRNPAPGEREIQDALLGNLCRCTGYVQIVRAIRRAAEAGQEPPANVRERQHE